MFVDGRLNLSLTNTVIRYVTKVNPGPDEPMYAYPLQTVQIQSSWPTDLDLHCVSAWYLNLFSLTRVDRR